MKKIMFVLSLGVLCASLAFAQDTPQSDQSGSASASTSSSGSSSIQGCLNGSDGSYTLTQDGGGMTYKLMGSENQLKKHVGHEVAITGQVTPGGSGNAASASDSGQSGSGAGSSEGSMIQVTSVKMVSKHCTSSTDTPQPR